MATIPSVEIEIGGKTRELKYPLMSFSIAQRRYGIRIPISAMTDPTIADMAEAVWLGLLHDYPRLDLSRVIQWVEEEEHPLFETWARAQGPLLEALERLGAKTKTDTGEAREEDNPEDLLVPLEESP